MTYRSVINPGYHLPYGEEVNKGIAYPQFAYQSGVVAGSGAALATATRITETFTEVTTVTSVGDAIALPQALPGMFLSVKNSGANACTVFALGGSTIGGVPGAAGLLQAPGTALYMCFRTREWVQLKVSSAEPSATDVGYDVFLVVGQSNAVGAGLPAPDANNDPLDARISIWSAYAYQNQIVVANEQNLHGTATVGFVLPFAREYVKTLPPNRGVLLVNAAIGSTGFTSNYWNWTAGNPGGSGYERAIQLANGAMGTHRNNRLAGILAHMGEQDSINLQSQSDNSAAWKALIDGLRSRVVGASATTPFVIGEIAPEFQDSHAGAAAIVAAKVALTSERAYTGYWVGQRNYVNADQVHYSSVGQRTNGLATFDAFQRAQVNVGLIGNPAVPAAPTGLVVSVMPTSAVLSWDVGADASIFDYQLQYRTSAGPGAWTIFAHPALMRSAATVGPAIAAGPTTITGLSAETGYDFRIAAVNTSGPSAFSAIVTATTPAKGLLDAVTASVSQAFSMFKLRSTYAGAVIRVRRSSDNAEQDIGFVGGASAPANTMIDTAALLAFVGANSGYVTKAYDQSLVGAHLTYDTLAHQPRIVNAGVLETTPNGKPAMRFIGSFLYNTAAYPLGTDIGVHAVLAMASPQTTGNIVAGDPAGNHNLYVTNTGVVTWQNGASGGALDTAIHMIQATYVNSTKGSTVYVDGSSVGTGTQVTAPASNVLTLGVSNITTPTGFFSGWIGENVVGNTLFSAADLTAMHTITTANWGTP